MNMNNQSPRWPTPSGSAKYSGGNSFVKPPLSPTLSAKEILGQSPKVSRSKRDSTPPPSIFIPEVKAPPSDVKISSDTIKVIARFRPLKGMPPRADASAHFDGNIHDCYLIDGLTNSVEVTLDSSDKKKFTYDRIFGPRSTQQDIFQEVEGVIDSVLDGFNGAILAYGQTAAGKSFTMEGPSWHDRTTQGVISRSIDKLFHLISLADDTIEFQIVASYCEVYNEKLRDLLNPKEDNMKIRESKTEGFIVHDLTEAVCVDKDELFRIIELGKANRMSAPTLMNAESSRSHSIFSVTVKQKNLETGRRKKGRLFLVDLAGSEKVGKSGATGVRLEEAKSINSSLSILGMVINSLCEGQPHVPYRDSKLTKVLAETLGGNSKTVLIVCCAPEPIHVPETVSSLRFGERAKRVKNVAIMNEEYSVEELRNMLAEAKQEIERLRKRLSKYENPNTANAESKNDENDSLDTHEDDEDDRITMSPPPGRKLNRQMSEASARIAASVDQVLSSTDDSWKSQLFEPLDIANEKISKLESENSMLKDDIEEERSRYEQERNWRVHLDAEVHALKATVSDLEGRLLKATMEQKRDFVSYGEGRATRSPFASKTLYETQFRDDQLFGLSPRSDISQLSTKGKRESLRRSKSSDAAENTTPTSMSRIYDMLDGVLASITFQEPKKKDVAANDDGEEDDERTTLSGRSIDHDYVDGEFEPKKESSITLDQSERYLLLKVDYERQLEKLSLKCDAERQQRLMAEAELEKALVKIDEKEREKLSVPMPVQDPTSAFFSFLANPLNMNLESRPDNQMVMALETSQNRVVELIKELESMRESHAIILETKDSVFRQLIKQNSQISAERDSLNHKLEQLTLKTDQLTNLLRSFQTRTSSFSRVRQLVSEHSKTIQGGHHDASKKIRTLIDTDDSSIDGSETTTEQP